MTGSYPLHRRVGIRSKAPAKPRKKPLRRKRLAKPKPPGELYYDAFGVAFHEVRFWLPDDTRLWPSIPQHRLLAPNVCQFMHEWYAPHGSGFCWLCGRFGKLEAHHVVSRWDFAGNIVMVCGSEMPASCHTRVQHNEEALPEVLRALWKYGGLFVSWVHLTRAYGKHWSFDSLD